MPELYQTRLAKILVDAMEAQQVASRDLVRATGMTYEHIRRVLKGLSTPSPSLLKLICDHLNLDEVELAQYAAADSIERKYGEVPALISGKNPEMAPIEQSWPHLTPEQKGELVRLATGWAESNKE